jgi:hypothetical protein
MQDFHSNISEGSDIWPNKALFWQLASENPDFQPFIHDHPITRVDKNI